MKTKKSKEKTDLKKEKEKTVIVYSTSTCPWCEKTKDFLNEKGIQFKNVNVGEDKAATQEMIKLSGQMGVPVIDINGTIIVGYDPDRIEMVLAKRK
ncbi:NrdH-redoxin [Candidatus Pacearchaeota archaeon CG10_big_fil_rev_8_21_14_0_10_32_14]|nr:MAG: NrdH-redoxin [Candidatus Pacearchaeota archaeon CG10_big_fil_rev_8_21_14_0_10_32_14]